MQVLRYAVLIFLLTTFPVFAGTYWVDDNGAADWGSCESGSALSGASACGLQTALNNVAANDTVYMRGGTYNRGLIFVNLSGTSGSRITFEAYNDETVEIKNTANNYAGQYYALFFRNSSYITIRGIYFERAVSGEIFFEMQRNSDYNIIDDCEFNPIGGVWRIYSGVNDTPAQGCNHNWIRNSTVYYIGRVKTNCEDNGGMRLGGADFDDHSGNNTFENNHFYKGAHHVLEVHTKNNAFINNHMHNEGSYANPGGCTNPTSARNGMYGNRVFDIYDTEDNPRMGNVVEGNRFGPSAMASDGGVGGTVVITSKGNIYRYNDIYYSENAGVYFKAGYGGKANGRFNRIYNNTLYYNGQDSQLRPNGTNGRHSFQEACATGFCQDNIIKNVISYQPHTNHFAFKHTQDYSQYWIDSDGDPLFINTTLTDPASATQPNLALQASSGAIDIPAEDNYGRLTQANGSGSNSTTLKVDDGWHFQDGTVGSSLSHGISVFPDWIAIGNVGNVAEISSIDYDTHTITLATPKTWSNNDNVWIYRNLQGERVLYGSAPDYGAHEYSGADTQNPVVTITSPPGATHDNGNVSTISITGTASDDTGVAFVTWSNNLGGASGIASGTNNWSVTGINLLDGINTITVAAYDTANNSGNDSVQVTYTQTDGIPVKLIGDGSEAKIGDGATVRIRGN